MTVSDSSAARAVAHRLLAREMPEHGTPDAIVTGAEYVLAYLFRNLSQWIGVTGCHTLFARAITLSAPHHPVLTGVRHQRQGPPHFECLGENAREYGSQATADGVTTVLATIITMLAGLIGEDMAMSLLDEVPIRTPEIVSATAPEIASDAARSLPPRTDDKEAAS